jgi:hypothetical protein
MRPPPLQTIAERADKNAYDVDALDWDGGVDPALSWFPEGSTPLYFTDAWSLLGEEERLQYNQWYALSINEQFIFLETELLNRAMYALLRGRALPAALRPLLEGFVEEEDKHTEMFRRLARMSWPEVYERSDYHFFQPGALNRALIRVACERPELFVSFPFLAMALEEKTVAFYREYEKHELEHPGELDPLYRAVHRFHMLDETRHIHIDEHLIEAFWESAPRWKRAFNVPLLLRTLRQYTVPRRRSARVNIVLALVDKFPRLAPHKEQLVRAVRSLGDNPAFQARIYGRTAMPRTFAMFDRYPELAGASRVAPSYRPQASAG